LNSLGEGSQMNKVLLVEDLPIVREPMTRLLQREGYSVMSAANGVEALELLRRHEVDLVLLDVMMPRLDGVKLLECMRANPSTAEIAVIAVTAVLDSARLKRLRELGVTVILPKGSFTYDALLGEMSRVCGGTAAAAKSG
jgi:CheY-like chemotaxis protein